MKNKQVVIGMKNGQPYVVACSRNVDVIFKAEKKPTMKKKWKTLVYNFKSKVGLVEG